MTTPNERLRSAREKRGYESAAEAARAFGWNENTYASHENGNRGIPQDSAIKYARAFRFSLDWLYLGGSLIKTEGLQEEPCVAFRIIPRLEWDAITAHGGVEKAMERAVAFASLPKTLNITMPAFTMIVSGDGMLNTSHPGPSFSHGDEVVFSTRAPIKPGDFVLAELLNENTVVFRQYRERGKTSGGFMTFELAPLNTSYPTTMVSGPEEARIVAKMTHAIKAY
jgi:hypothetical protein